MRCWARLFAIPPQPLGVVKVGYQPRDRPDLLPVKAT
jgi:hypothetical protein